ncbi:EYxxD motif small membrane protein [Salinithrix halophila]|uniref:EYxxD motif small membrane protein n=1 Tax=Salinithrix halophila TaxID=1485204 RepID=A0ABV8JI15_9BACL
MNGFKQLADGMTDAAYVLLSGIGTLVVLALVIDRFRKRRKGS